MPTQKTTFREIPLLAIRPSPMDAQKHRRASFEVPALQELADSITQNGVAQAILVRPLPIGGKETHDYEIVAGERRFLAAGMAGLERIPCTVRELNDEQVVMLQLVENLQRLDLHPMHEAESYEELKKKHGKSVDEIWPLVGKSKAYVYGRLKLLALSKACRKAFYAGEVSASIAEKLARIPVQSLQDEALEAVLGFPHAKQTWNRRDPMSFRQALEHINKHYTLDLRAAPFPITDEKLAGVGPCGPCPKRTGNAPDLFGDLKSDQVCTDTVCFAAKTNAYGQRLLEEAKKTGQHTLVGKAALAVAPNGAAAEHSYLKDGWHRLDGEFYDGNRHVKVRNILKPDGKTALIQDKGGRVTEIVHVSELKKTKATAPASSSSDSKWRRDQKLQQARAKAETAVRRAVFSAIAAKGKWKAPPARTVAELVAGSMDWDSGEALLKLLGVPETKSYHDRIERHVATLKTDEQLQAFLAQAYLAEELHVSSYGSAPKMPRLEAAAKTARVDVAKIRKELTPKAKPKAKAKRRAR